MSKKKKATNILQVGSKNWGDSYQISEKFRWFYVAPDKISDFISEQVAQKEAYEAEQKLLQEMAKAEVKVLPKPKVKPPTTFSACLLTDEDYSERLLDLLPYTGSYEVFYSKYHQPTSDWAKEFLYRKMAHRVDMREPQVLIDTLVKSLFSGQYGAKMPVSDLRVTDNFKGEIQYDGHSFLCLDGFYGEDFQQIAHFRYNVSHYGEVAQNFFFEHLCGPGVETKIVVQMIAAGSLEYISHEWEFEGNQTKEQFVIDTVEDGFIALSMFAKGSGELKLGPCHYRNGRGQLGEFILGGERFVDDEQQEFMYYFDPQDFKPPFCVYFSGFRSAEGFEGYWMMKHMGTPFMLICDPRLEGGSFYIGSEQLEQRISDVIQEKLDFLGFDNSQLILSGLSMGTFGAVYHGSKLSPHAIVIGKPVFSLGEVALKERINRPAGFPTSLDILRRYAGDMDDLGAAKLDNRFWWQFDKGDFSKTTFAIAYMKDDDYDATAFEKVLDRTRQTTATVIGRGWPGRHGDGGSGPTLWFLNQYYKILKNDFGREY